MSLLLVCALIILPFPYLYDTRPWFKFRTKFLVYYLWLTIMSFLMIPISLLRPKSVDNSRIGSYLMVPLSSLLGITWEIDGETHLLQRDEAFVIVANHQSSIDLLGMFQIWGQLRRVAALAKQSLMYYGSFGITAFLCGTIFIDRSNPASATSMLNSMTKTLKREGTKLLIFPEGTRNSDKSVPLLPFKKGAFHVSINSDIPILPIVISQHKFLDANGLIFDSGCGRITVLPLIRPKTHCVEDLAKITRDAMLQSLKETSS